MEGTDKSRIRILPVGPSDMELLRVLSVNTFREAFEKQNAAEHMDAYVAEAMGPAKLAAELANDSSRFHFVYRDDQLVGYLKVNFGSAQTEQFGGDSMEIERIYVYAHAHGSGAGQALLDAAMRQARAAGAKFVWLGVWEHNLRAQRFYRKNGFSEFGSHVFYLGTDAQTDVLMKREL